MTSLHDKLEELTDPTFLDRATEPPLHPRCLGVISFTYHKPTRRELSLKILYYTVAKAKTPWWRVWRRMKLQAAINQSILEGRSHGYFNPQIKDTL